MAKKPTVLMILDGYGLNEKTEANAVAKGCTPVMDMLMEKYPFVKGNASGLAVGLPDGQMGNSEVGHINMGAGRIVYQELTRITKEIEDGTFFTNEVYSRLLVFNFSVQVIITWIFLMFSKKLFFLLLSSSDIKSSNNNIGYSPISS